MADERQIYQVFCGNFEYDASEREVSRMFSRYGRVERVDMKTGFAFVYMSDKRDAEDAIRGLDRREFGYKRRKLRVEWAKVGDRGMRLPPVPAAREEARRRSQAPTATLFVVNFDVRRTRQRDLERHFDTFGRLKRVDIKKSYAFVEFEAVDSAVDAQRELDGSTFMGREITVEFVTNEDPHSRRNQDVSYRSRSRSRSPRRSRSRSPRYRTRSPPYARDRSPARSVSPRRDRSPKPSSRSRSRSSLRDPSPKREASRSPSRSRSRSRGRSYSRSKSRSPRR